MLSRIQEDIRNSRSSEKVQSLREQVIALRRDMDVYERQFSTWRQSRRLRERQADVRFNVVEAQLARLSGSDRMGISSSCPTAPPMDPQPVIFAIGAYRI